MLNYIIQRCKVKFPALQVCVLRVFMIKGQKTIFIIITRSFITRNILRSGPLELLKKSGHKIVVFFHAKNIPEHVEKEFKNDNVFLFAVEKPPLGRVHRRFVAIKDYLLYTDSNKVRFLYGRKNSGWRLLDFFFLALVRFFSLFYPLKPIFRWADFYFFSFCFLWLL